MKLLKQDKGQNQCVARFMDSLKKGHSSPIDRNELFEVSRVAIGISSGESKNL